MSTPPRDSETAAGETAQLWSHGGETANWRSTKATVGFTPRSMNWLDVVLILAGLAVLMLSFFGYYTHTLARSFGSTSRVSNAWDDSGSHIWGWGAAVAAGAGATFLFAAILLANAGTRSLVRWSVLALFVVSAAALGAAYSSVPHYSFAALDGYFADSTDGHGYAYWASVVLVLLAVLAAVQRLRQVAADDTDVPAADEMPATPPTSPSAPRRGRHSS